MLKSINTLALGLIMVLGACSTKKDDTPTTTPPVVTNPENLAGTWVLPSVETDDTDIVTDFGTTSAVNANGTYTLVATPKLVFGATVATAKVGVSVTSAITVIKADTFIGFGATGSDNSAVSIKAVVGKLLVDNLQTSATVKATTAKPATADVEAVATKITAEKWQYITLAPNDVVGNWTRTHFQKNSLNNTPAVIVEGDIPGGVTSRDITGKLAGLVRRVSTTKIEYIPLANNIAAVKALTLADFVSTTATTDPGLVVEIVVE